MSPEPTVLAATGLGVVAAAGYLGLAVVADCRDGHLPGWFASAAVLPAAVGFLLSTLAMRGTVAPAVSLVGVALAAAALAPVARGVRHDGTAADEEPHTVAQPAD